MAIFVSWINYYAFESVTGTMMYEPPADTAAGKPYNVLYGNFCQLKDVSKLGFI
jgi:hypothetical protein